MKRCLFVLLLLLALPGWASAQQPRFEQRNLDAADETASINVFGSGTTVVQISGTYVGTNSFEGTADGSNWVSVSCVNSSSTAESSTTTTGLWTCSVAGLRLFRVNMSAYTSGTASVALSAASVSSVGNTNLSGVTISSGRLHVLADINNGAATTSRNNSRVEGCVSISSDFSACDPVMVVSRADTATLTNVNDTNASTALVAANASRLHAKCFNDSTAILYINYGATATTSAFTERVEPGGSWFMEWPIYTGVINGIWSADASGAARCTELTQ